MGEEEGEFEVLAYVLKSGVRDLSLNKFLDLTDFLCTSNSQLSTGLLEDPSPWHWHLRAPKHPEESACPTISVFIDGFLLSLAVAIYQYLSRVVRYTTLLAPVLDLPVQAPDPASPAPFSLSRPLHHVSISRATSS